MWLAVRHQGPTYSVIEWFYVTTEDLLSDKNGMPLSAFEDGERGKIGEVDSVGQWMRAKTATGYES